MNKHTPGPWTAHFEEAYFVTGIDGGRVAMITHLKGPYGAEGRSSAEETAANCRLIAAAPNLLRQRDELLDVVREFVQTMDLLPDSDETSLCVWGVYDTARKLIERIQWGGQ